MNGSMRRLLFASRRGTTVVESGLMIPLLLILIFGALETGALLHTRHTMLHAARDTARRLAVENITISAAEQHALDLLGGDDFAWEVTATKPAADALDREVTVEIALKMAEASLGDVMGLYGDERMTVNVSMRSEY